MIYTYDAFRQSEHCFKQRHNAFHASMKMQVALAYNDSFPWHKRGCFLATMEGKSINRRKSFSLTFRILALQIIQNSCKRHVSNILCDSEWFHWKLISVELYIYFIVIKKIRNNYCIGYTILHSKTIFLNEITYGS